MTTLDERNADLLHTDDDPGFVQLIAELDVLGEGRPSPRGDLMVRHALAARARDLAHRGAKRPIPVGGAQQRRWTRLPRARLSVAAAASILALLSVGTYLNSQSPTSVSAQTVLHHAAAAGPGPNAATHAAYRVSSSGDRTGTADVWVGYDKSGTATELTLTVTMTQNGHPAADMSGSLVATGPSLLQLYNPVIDQAPGPVPDWAGKAPSSAPTLACMPCGMLKGTIVGTLLAQKLSTQPNTYHLQGGTLDGVPVYTLQVPQDAAGDVTFYFNAQSYRLEGVDWMQGGSSWQARLVSYSTEPLSAFPAHTFVTGADASQQHNKLRISVNESERL